MLRANYFNSLHTELKLINKAKCVKINVKLPTYLWKKTRPLPNSPFFGPIREGLS